MTVIVQAYLEWQGLAPPAESLAAIDAYTTFLPYVQHWIDGSQGLSAFTVPDTDGLSFGMLPSNFVTANQASIGKCQLKRADPAELSNTSREPDEPAV